MPPQHTAGESCESSESQQLIPSVECYVGNQSNKDAEKQAVLNHIMFT